MYKLKSKNETITDTTNHLRELKNPCIERRHDLLHLLFIAYVYVCAVWAGWVLSRYVDRSTNRAKWASANICHVDYKMYVEISEEKSDGR